MMIMVITVMMRVKIIAKIIKLMATIPNVRIE
jgi:hypothetical protein